MKIAIGCDHGGIVLKDAVIRAITDLGMEYEDFGTYTDASVDYPDYAEKVGRSVAAGEADRGVLLCGTGIGISIAANKIKGIRAAHVTDAFQAEMCRAHNDANVLTMGGRVNSPEDAYNFTKIFLTTAFQGGRHLRRVEKISALEK